MSLLVQRKLFHREWQVSSRPTIVMITTEMGGAKRPVLLEMNVLPSTGGAQGS